MAASNRKVTGGSTTRGSSQTLKELKLFGMPPLAQANQMANELLTKDIGTLIPANWCT